MSNDLVKRNQPADVSKRHEQTEDAASRLKAELMADALDRMFGKDEPAAPVKGTPRVILALANHGRSPGWDYAKEIQRDMFAAAGSGLEMKFAFYGPDDAAGVRRCRITSRWISDPNDMANVMGRAECTCGCYVNIRDVLGQAVKENQDRPMRAVVIIGDAFHDSQDGLDEAAIFANQLRRTGTRVFFVQQGDDPVTARKLKWLAQISGNIYFRYDPRTQERQLAEMLDIVSAFAAGGEDAVKKRGGEAATLLLEHLKQEPMPIIEERVERVKTKVER
jgi:hypothetical protein